MDKYDIKFFKQFIYELKLNGRAKSISEIAKKTGIKGGQSRLSQVINGHVPFTQDFADMVYSVYPINKNITISHTENNIVSEPKQEYKSEGKVIKDEDYPEKEVFVIPVKGKGGLENAYFDDMVLSSLEVERIPVKKQSSKGSKWFKVEVEGASMDDSTETEEGSKYSLVEGDWVYCRSIPKIHWKSKLHFDRVKVFCFFHNKRGIIFKKVIEHNVETGDLVLHSLNKNKKKYKDFVINIAECSYICNIMSVVTEFN